MPLTPANQCDHFAGIIDSIETIDSTDISEGLQMALEIISRPTQIVLMTDGHQNCGSAIPVAEKLKQHSIIECIGIGGSPQDVDEALLREIASENPDGTRRYRWIGDKQRLIQHFQQLAGRISRS